MEEKLVLGQKPQDKDFHRVHAILLTKDQRVLLRYKNGEARVTGGRIDPQDRGLVAALKRELLEEINCQIDKCDYLGYIKEVDPDTGEVEYWARMVARVSEIGPAKPDPDRAGQWIYGRVLVPREQAEVEMSKTTKFAQSNQRLLARAYQVAEEQHYFTEKANCATEILNPEVHG